jgi:hypothetical protein
VRQYGHILPALMSALAVASCSSPEHPTPAGEPPAAPDNIRGRALGVRGAEVGWRDRSGGKAWFEIERSAPGDELFARVGTKPPGVTVLDDWGLAPESAYRYRVRARVGGAASPWTSEIEVLTDTTSIPEPRVEVFDPMAVSPGVTLFNVEDRHNVHSTSVLMAVDEQGTVVWHFEYQTPFVSETDIWPNGDILAQVGPAISRIDRKGDLVDYVDDYFLHHDVDILPWGNIIAITSVGKQEIEKGTPDTYSRDWIIEFEPDTRSRVRTIHVEFLIPFEDICNACITTWVVGGDDWTHVNALDYDLTDQSLYVSVRNLNRIYKLSYPEGEVQWVMGDGGDFGEGLFHHQHNPYRIAPGRMLMFDNGLHDGPIEPDRSRVIEVEYDPTIPDARIVWSYDGPPSFFSEAQGDAIRLPNGNTLIVDSFAPRILEITPEGMPVWELTLPKPYLIYKAHRIEIFP